MGLQGVIDGCEELLSLVLGPTPGRWHGEFQRLSLPCRLRLTVSRLSMRAAL